MNYPQIWVRMEGLNTRFKVANGLGYLYITRNVWSREHTCCPVALVKSGRGWMSRSGHMCLSGVRVLGFLREVVPN